MIGVGPWRSAGRGGRRVTITGRLSAISVVRFPVLVLAEGSAIAGHVAAAAGLVGFAAAVPAILEEILKISYKFR